jgi:hypothetical protein
MIYETTKIYRDIDGTEQEFEVRVGLGFDTYGMVVIEESTVAGQNFDLTLPEHRELTSHYRAMQRRGGFND